MKCSDHSSLTIFTGEAGDTYDEDNSSNRNEIGPYIIPGNTEVVVREGETATIVCRTRNLTPRHRVSWTVHWNYTCTLQFYQRVILCWKIGNLLILPHHTTKLYCISELILFTSEVCMSTWNSLGTNQWSQRMLKDYVSKILIYDRKQYSRVSRK